MTTTPVPEKQYQIGGKGHSDEAMQAYATQARADLEAENARLRGALCQAAPVAQQPQAEAVPQDVGQLEYRGNSVAYIHQKMTAYRGAVDAAWQAMRDAGHPPDGHTPLAQAVTKALAPQQAEAVPSDDLHTFLDAAAGEGLVLDGVDAADLYIKMFPERYAAAIAQQKGGA